MPILVELLRTELTRRLGCERLRAGVQPAEAADMLARLTLSFIGHARDLGPGRPAAVRRLVRGQLLAGVLADRPSPERTTGARPGRWTMRRIVHSVSA